ncbi:class I SAM-dependent methyltransferase [Clostridium gelidum]|uniref:class I SAM-dependent methyltransferase n=1 Tax=Clostridium gelidum TaxID=704125 RepID=UPI002882F29C|nr:methyltransferase domain-containing protein [Clostridium gelidum]
MVNSQIHRLTTIRESLENIIDNIYENDSCKIDNNILGIIEKTYELNKIKENWKDRWDFDSWARNYDKDVREDKGALKIYANYDSILDKVYNLAVDSNINKPCILEIGVGTGNLSGKFLDKGYNIIAIDQSIEMLNVAKEKYPKLKVRLGDFLKIPYSNKTFDIIVSTYAFHHLNNNEKSIAIKEMARVLEDNGKIVIGDLMFKSNKDKDNIFQKLTGEQIEEINDEYYSYIDFLKSEFKEINKELKYTRIDNLIYVVEIQ